LFDSDAFIADSDWSGRGTDAIGRIVDPHTADHPGPRQVHSQEVTWTEDLRVWPISPEGDLQLKQEVPPATLTRVMCAIVRDGKIRALTTGTPNGLQPCNAAEEALSAGSQAPWVLAPATSVAVVCALYLLSIRRRATATGRLINGLQVWTLRKADVARQLSKEHSA
jgi:hypothetical protein